MKSLQIFICTLARRGPLGLATGAWWLAAALACICALGGCGGGQEVVVKASAGSHCPGGALTAAGVRLLRAQRSPAGAGISPSPGCAYLTAATIGRAGEGVFRQPEAVAVGPSGRVYVADQFSHVVQMFSPAGVFEGQWGSAGAGRGEFGAVGGLATDPRGDVYLVDSTHNRVEKYDAAGRFIVSWGTTGKGVGQFYFGAGIGPDIPPGGGIAVGGSHVYVSDTGNYRIERFALDGSGAKVLAGAGSGRGQVRWPVGLAVAQQAAGTPAGSEASEALYVADNGNQRVQELTPDGRFLAQAKVFDASPSTFQNPWDVAVHDGSVYVVDNNHGRVVRFDRSLRFTGSFSGSGPYRLTDFLRAVATSAAGEVYVADTSADRVEMFSAAGAPIRAWGSSGIAPGQFVAPVDVVAGRDGRLLVAEAFREIVPLYPAGARMSYRAEIAYDSPWSSGGGVTIGSRFFSPTDLALAPDGTVWVTDRNNDVLRHLSASGSLLGAAGGGASAPASGRSPRFTEPHGVAAERTGGVIVADTGANRVQKLAPDGGLLAVWSSPAVGLSGGSGSDPRAGRFQRPLAVAVGAAGSIYVADTGNDRVEELGAGGRLIASWGGRGSAAGLFESPDGLAVDAGGDVFVADGVLDRIQEFTAHGKLLAVWGRTGTGLGELAEPTGTSIDCRGDLLVADTGNNRVAIFTRVAPSGCPPTR